MPQDRPRDPSKPAIINCGNPVCTGQIAVPYTPWTVVDFPEVSIIAMVHPVLMCPECGEPYIIVVNARRTIVGTGVNRVNKPPVPSEEEIKPS